MELILSVLAAGPIGYVGSSRKRGLVTYLVAWAVVFPIQTFVVFSTGDGDGNDPLYWVFNALILGAGIGLNLLGSTLRARRTPTRSLRARGETTSERGPDARSSRTCT